MQDIQPLKLGDWVIVHFKDSIPIKDMWVHPSILAWGLNESIYEHTFGTTYYKGRIVKIQTHHCFGLLKLKKPIYWVKTIGGPDFIQVKTHNPKRLIRGPNYETRAQRGENQ